MERDDRRGGSIQAFFESAEGENLYLNCPFRPHLSRLRELDEATVNNILAHMLGHIIDYKAGRPGRPGSGEAIPAIDQANINPELRYIYNDCNNVALNERRRVDPHTNPDDRLEYGGFGPEDNGCFGVDARAELMAEAIRAYLQNPNYLNTVAPNVAARIGAAVNGNPNLNKIIHFN